MSYLLPAGSVPRRHTKLGVYRTRVMRSRGLGQDSTDIDIVTGLPCDDPRANCGPMQPSGIAPSPSQPGVNPAVQQAYKNLLTQQQNSQDPLDYVSPEAAIAAGLNPQVVYAAWSKAMARFPTQQSALQAGIPAGVVTQLWAQSRTAAAVATFKSVLDAKSFFGIANKYLLGAGLGLALLSGLRGRR